MPNTSLYVKTRSNKATTGILHADMTLARSKVKVKVTGLLNFRQLAKPCMLAAMIVSPLGGLSGYISSL